MIYIDEQKAREAGRNAAQDAICEFADNMRAQDVARLFARSDRLDRSPKQAAANRAWRRDLRESQAIAAMIRKGVVA